MRGSPRSQRRSSAVGRRVWPSVRRPRQPGGQYNGFVGGNPNLNPEKATTKTLGVVLQPRFIPRLAITVDWYDIKIKNAIQGFGADAILNNCVNNSTCDQRARRHAP